MVTPQRARSSSFCFFSAGGSAVRVGKSTFRKTKSPANAFTKSGCVATSSWNFLLGGDQSEPVNSASTRRRCNCAWPSASAASVSHTSAGASARFAEVAVGAAGRGRGGPHGTLGEKSTRSTLPSASVMLPCG